MNIAEFIEILTYGHDHADADAKIVIRIEGDEYDVSDTLTFERDHYVIDITDVDEVRRGPTCKGGDRCSLHDVPTVHQVGRIVAQKEERSKAISELSEILQGPEYDQFLDKENYR